MEVPRTEHESGQSGLWNLGNRDRGLNRLDVPLLQPTIGANSIVVIVKEQMRATESLGNGALAFKQSLCLHPKHLVPDMVTLPWAESCSSRAFCMQNSLSRSLMPDYSDHPLSIFLLTNYIHNFFGLVKVCSMHSHVVKSSCSSNVPNPKSSICSKKIHFPRKCALICERENVFI